MGRILNMKTALFRQFLQLLRLWRHPAGTADNRPTVEHQLSGAARSESGIHDDVMAKRPAVLRSHQQAVRPPLPPLAEGGSDARPHRIANLHSEFRTAHSHWRVFRYTTNLRKSYVFVVGFQASSRRLRSTMKKPLRGFW